VNLAIKIARPVCLLAVSGAFLYAASSKIIEPRQFVVAIKNYRMVHEAALHAMALILPWWEVGAAIALLIPKTRRAGAMLITGMLLMFIAAVSYAALYKGYNIDCGCFGKNSAKAGFTTIGLDLALLIAIFFATWPKAPVQQHAFPIDSASKANS
jgi:uncharacterized membrane protein YphA (DoxX/SURF4 family)